MGDNSLHGTHAEETVLSDLRKIRRKLGKDVELTLLVIRVRRADGELAMSRPCPKCSCAIRRSRINVKSVIYSVKQDLLHLIPVVDV